MIYTANKAIDVKISSMKRRMYDFQGIIFVFFHALIYMWSPLEDITACTLSINEQRDTSLDRCIACICVIHMSKQYPIVQSGVSVPGYRIPFHKAKILKSLSYLQYASTCNHSGIHISAHTELLSIRNILKKIEDNQ